MFNVGDTVWFNKDGIWDSDRSDYVGIILEKNTGAYYNSYEVQLLPEYHKAALAEMSEVANFDKESFILPIAEDWLSPCESASVSVDVSDFL